jgi:hypothetical protein
MNDKFCYKLYKHCGYCVPSNWWTFTCGSAWLV